MEALRKVMGTQKASTSMKFSELVERWKAMQVPAMKLSTVNHYQHALRAITPVFGLVEVATITRHDVEQFVQDRARKYSRSSLHSFRTTLSLVLGYAVSNGWIEKNPVIGLRLPRAENCGGDAITRCKLTSEQVVALAESLDEPFSTLVLSLASTGLRIGEAAGLRWSDLQNNVLHVQRRIYYGKQDDLKTKGSNRKLPLPDALVSRLLKLKKGDTWIFQASNGAALNPGNWLRREVRPAAKKLGIGLTGWHDFRHYFTHQLRRRKTHPKVLSGMLGHSGVTLAMEDYDYNELVDFQGSMSEMLHDVMKSEVPASNLSTVYTVW